MRSNTLNSKIKEIKAREVLDSRGNPTVEVELKTELGSFLALTPSGASKGKYEAKEVRDNENRYHGMGVLEAVNNVNNIIGPAIIGKDSTQQEEIDNFINQLDGTPDKSRLGVNAILPVSIAVCRAGAAAKNIPLYKHIQEFYKKRFSNQNKEEPNLKIPTPCFNIINGGAHAGNFLDFQEFMIVPQFEEFSKNLQAAVEIYQELKVIIKDYYGGLAINVGDEGGFTPPIKIPNEALDLILRAVKNLNYQKEVKIILDVAASQFFNQTSIANEEMQGNKYKTKMGVFTSDGLLNYYFDLIQNYPILGLEDPFGEDDFDGWQQLNSKVKSQSLSLLIIGDDLLATNIERIKITQEKGLCNAAIIKPNQIGTLTETIKAVDLAKYYGWKVVVSHRSGDTYDDFIADLAVGVGADFIKSGAPARGERVAKYNRLLKIESYK